MKDKLVGLLDPDGNYGLPLQEADKLRIWAKERQKRIDADPGIPRRHRALADWRRVTKSVTKLGCPKKHTSEAEKQRAYRDRRKSSEEPIE